MVAHQRQAVCAGQLCARVVEAGCTGCFQSVVRCNELYEAAADPQSASLAAADCAGGRVGSARDVVGL